MLEWKVEDLALFNDKSKIFIGFKKIYSCEKELSREEKIECIDRMQDGKLSYLLDLLDKFHKEKGNSKCDYAGAIKTVSLKAWFKKNDSRCLVDDVYDYRQFNFLGVTRYIQCFNEKGQYDTYRDLVDELFHRQLKKI